MENLKIVMGIELTFSKVLILIIIIILPIIIIICKQKKINLKLKKKLLVKKIPTRNLEVFACILRLIISIEINYIRRLESDNGASNILLFSYLIKQDLPLKKKKKITLVNRFRLFFNVSMGLNYLRSSYKNKKWLRFV